MNIGKIVQVIGPVVDVEFPVRKAPVQLQRAQDQDAPSEGNGSAATLTVEVASHLGDNIVRTIAMGADRGPDARHRRRGHRRPDHRARRAARAWAA